MKPFKIKVCKQLLPQRLPISYWMFCIYIGLVIGAYIRPNRVINEIVVVVTLIIILEGFYFFFLIRHLKITLEDKKIVEVGEVFKQEIKVTNNIYLPSPYIYLVARQGKRVQLSQSEIWGLMLGGREECILEVSYIALYCGREALALEQMILRSFLGFFRIAHKIEAVTHVQILPEIKKIMYLSHFDEFLKDRTTGIEREQGKYLTLEEDNEVGYELRPYVEGDSERLIHWKIVAFKEEYLVRQREAEKNFKKKLFFILSPFMAPVEWQNETSEGMSAIGVHHKMITSFVSLVAYYLEQGQKVRVAYYKDKEWRYMKLTGMGHVRYLQEQLSEYEGTDVETARDARNIIKGLLKLIEKKNGVKVMISSYYWQGMVDETGCCELDSYNQLAMVWTGDDIGERPAIHTAFWQITNAYELVLDDQINEVGADGKTEKEN